MSLMGLFAAITFGGPTDVVGRTKVRGLVVSTVFTTDMGYETALIDENGTHPVERYPTKGEAVAGHKRWCAKAKIAKTITKLGYGDLSTARKTRLRRSK